MRLNDRVRHWIASWTGEDRQVVTIQDLLEHCSGLPGHRRYFESRRGRASFELAICEEPLEYAPRTAVDLQRPRLHAAGLRARERRGRAARSAVRCVARSRARRRCRAALSAGPPSGSSAPRRPKTRRLARSVAARCTTRTPRRSAASPRTRDCSAPPPRSARARGGGCARPRCRCSPRRPRCPAARARSRGTRCCRPRRAARSCRRARSVTPGSPARRCGSIPRRISMW